MKPKRSELEELYGKIDVDKKKWEDEEKHMVFVDIIPQLRQHLKYHHIYCNKDMAEPLQRALLNISRNQYGELIKSYDGCFNIRPSRSDSRLSVHSYGLAIDLNAETNQLGTKGAMPQEIVDCFKQEGFVWGGDWEQKDGMHFQYVTEDEK